MMESENEDKLSVITNSLTGVSTFCVYDLAAENGVIEDFYAHRL